MAGASTKLESRGGWYGLAPNAPSATFETGTQAVGAGAGSGGATSPSTVPGGDAQSAKEAEYAQEVRTVAHAVVKQKCNQRWRAGHFFPA